jgi:nucleotide-binding universal stress UspA family protein
MNRIVIATDGSAPAKEAVEVGLELAVEHGADVTFVHVLRRDEWYRRWSWMSRIWNGTQSGRPERVLGEAAAAAEEVGVSYRLQRMSGDTVDEIITVADAKDAGLVIVGSRGRGTVASALLGSVSNDLMKRAERDVFAVESTPVAVAAERPRAAGMQRQPSVMRASSRLQRPWRDGARRTSS